jgi:hypothetical protein
MLRPHSDDPLSADERALANQAWFQMMVSCEERRPIAQPLPTRPTVAPTRLIARALPTWDQLWLLGALTLVRSAIALALTPPSSKYSRSFVRSSSLNRSPTRLPLAHLGKGAGDEGEHGSSLR